MKTVNFCIVRLGTVIAATVLSLGVASSLSASMPKVNARVDLATPVMGANTQQTAYMKISLEGFERDDQHPRIPANVAIVLDKSGSMAGLKIEQAKEAAILAIQRLNDNDIVSIVTYDTVVDVVVPATKAENKQRIAQKIREIRSNGNTALFAGVSKAAQEVRKFISRNKVNRVILLSDGLANVGPQSPSELGELGSSLGKEGISVTTIGLGLGYNEDLMTQLAGYSDGNHAFVEDASELAGIFQYEFGDVLSVVAQNVDVQIECADGVKPIRVLGRKANIINNRVTTRLNQLYSGQEKYLILEVEISPQNTGTEKNIAKVGVQYNNLSSKQTDDLALLAKARFTSSLAEVKSNINTKAYEASVKQVANERSKAAIELRDKGELGQAKKIIQLNAEYLDAAQAYLPEPSRTLKAEAESIQEDAQLLEEENWNRARKTLKEKQYKASSQQSY